MLEKAFNSALSLLDTIDQEKTPSREEMENIAHLIFNKIKDKADFNVDDLINRLVSKYATVWEESNGLYGSTPHEEWLPLRRPNIDWAYWDRYRNYLISKKGWATPQVAILDKDTDKLLSKLENPLKQGPWFRRGLVVGDVQSGKTAHYTGLLNKSIDSGYKLIIVLAGIHNSLRSQTQNRLDKELVGFDSANRIWFGVGAFGEKPIHTIQQITNSSENGDLRRRQRNSPIGQDPVLLVIKKNKTPLESVISWIKGQSDNASGILKGVPTIVIDDESDQASVNTNDEETNPTTINKLIREMLSSLEQKNYVGYTATPFANIFIKGSGDDIFPEDFIFKIRPPSNYVGSSRIFGIKADKFAKIEEVSPLPLYVTVNDQNTFLPKNHKNTAQPEHLPTSLIRAINSFLITCAVRALRSGDELHNTMLVHVTRFNTVQEKVWDLISEMKDDYVQIFRYDSGSALSELKNQFSELYAEYLEVTNKLNSEHDIEKQTLPDFDEVFKKMSIIIERIEVKQINGSSEDVLVYKEGKGAYVIAVGGNKLSRGLTLEGLSVSYYLRNSQGYDTLLQMGRWFGYRPGYLDLCRIYTNHELYSAYNFISLAAEELNRDFEKLERRMATPKEWGLKVRTHPEGSIIITAANKMRATQNLEWTFSEKLVQTLSISLDKAQTLNNFKAYDYLITSLGNENKPEHHPNRPIYLWKNLNPSFILSFFERYSTHIRSPGAETSVLSEYIQKSNEHGELINWTIAVVGGEAKTSVYIDPEKKIKIQTVKRVGNYDFDTVNLATIYRGIISKEDEALDFENFKSDFSGSDLRELRPSTNGLLMIYPIEPSGVIEKFKTDHPELADAPNLASSEAPLIAFALSLPRSDHFIEIEYTVNEVMLQTMGFDAEDEDEVK